MTTPPRRCRAPACCAATCVRRGDTGLVIPAFGRACSPRRRLDGRGRRRRRRLRRRRAHHRTARRPPRQRPAGHQGLVDAGSTRWAQGGVAAALRRTTPPRSTCATPSSRRRALRRGRRTRAVHRGSDAVRELIALGAAFDRDPSGELSLTREGGHHRDRIVHAGGDATGPRSSARSSRRSGRTRDPARRARPRARPAGTADGRAAGSRCTCSARAPRTASGRCGPAPSCSPPVAWARSSRRTTNPPVSTGDGVALALRAGAAVADLEFVQFHPTALWLGAGSTGQQPLVSEAVRGEGAFLVDARGERVIAGVHPLADLAPRDVVAKAIIRPDARARRPTTSCSTRGHRRGLAARALPDDPRGCREAGIDPVRELIPVAPAAHYASGGVRTDLTAAPPSPACTPAARSRAPACTAPTGWRPTACSRGSSSPPASATTSPGRCRRRASRSPLDGRARCCSTRSARRPHAP